MSQRAALHKSAVLNNILSWALARVQGVSVEVNLQTLEAAHRLLSPTWLTVAITFV